MPLLQSSNEGNAPALQDPWFWGVDQVINALCDPHSQLRRSEPSLPLPDDLSRILHEYDVNGPALLEEVDKDMIRNVFGIKLISHLASINHLIRLLQASSQKYREHHPHPSPWSGLGRGSITGPDGILGPWQSPQSVMGQWYGRLPASENGASVQNPGRDRSQPLLEQGPIIHPPVSPTTASRNRTTHAEVNGLVLQPNEHATSGLNDQSEKRNDDLVQATTQSSGVSTNAALSTAIPEGTKVLGEVDFPGPFSDACPDMSTDLSGNDLAELTTHLDPDKTDTTEDVYPNQPPPGLLHYDPSGKKRVRPFLQSNLESEAGEQDSRELLAKIIDNNHHAKALPITQLHDSSERNGKKAKRTPDQLYLGLEALSIDKLFYGDTALEHALEHNAQTDEENFAFLSMDKQSNGLRLYVNARIKFFLQVSPISFKRQNKEYVGIVPYPDNIAKKHSPLSMTLFSRSEDDNVVSVKRASRLKWLQGRPPSGTSLAAEDSSNAFNIADAIMAADDDQDPDWSALEKWKYMDGEDKILPVYGDSGSEGEYDLDVWNEIEQEIGPLKRPQRRSGSQKLPVEEVEAAIDNAMQDMTQQWTLNIQPRLQAKAWRLWAKSRRDGDKRIKCEDLQDTIDSLDVRLNTMRERIIKEEWSTTNRVTKQCKIMQLSVFDREECKWKIQILELRKAPEKVQQIQKKSTVVRKKRAAEPPLAEGEELIISGDDENESSDDSLDGFVVEDDESECVDAQPPLPNDETIPADADDEMLDEIDSDAPFMESGKNNAGKDIAMPVVPGEMPGSWLNSTSNSSADIIDLTQMSSDTAESISIPIKKEPTYGIRTPPVCNSADEDSEERFQRSRSQKSTFKKPPTSYRKTAVIDLEESVEAEKNEYLERNDPLASNGSPISAEIEQIKHTDPGRLLERQDRKRLLIYTIAWTPPHQRQFASEVLNSTDMSESNEYVIMGLLSILDHKQGLENLERDISDGIMQIAAWYVCYTVPVKYSSSGLKVQDVKTTLQVEDGYPGFHRFLLECLKPYEEAADISTPSTSPTPKYPKRLRSVCEDSDNAFQGSTSHSKNKRHLVSESQETLAKRQIARQRADGHERRRKEQLRGRMVMMRGSRAESWEVIVNPGKLESQEYIRLNPRFGGGAQLKPHQVEGLQFLWREITVDHKELQGCLLAQTMGLGKTMQVIALLVSIAEAGRSSNENIRSQVPPSLRASQTLILCPPPLVDNWWDEMLIWAPEPRSENIGVLRKVGAFLDVEDRLAEIRAWSEEGGILLMGFSAFTQFIQNKSKKDKSGKILPPRLDEKTHQLIKDALLKRPTLVVADEAHEFKNPKSGINFAMNQIRTKSRIALTGSPLSNNLAEYFAIVDWIAPRYLGSAADFRAFYESPISRGLYEESHPSEYREARKCLRALELEMDPKVHRADASALHGNLHGKTEFVIKIPRTTIQDQLYRIFVRFALGDNGSNEPQPALLWKWLAILKLLCNHPVLFLDKLLSLEGELITPPKKPLPTKGKASLRNIAEDGLPTSEDDKIVFNEPDAKDTLSQIIPETKKLFESLKEPSAALEYSHKMQILMSIIEWSDKAQNKVLVFSHSLKTLDYIENELKRAEKEFVRIDGVGKVSKRQSITKQFNEGSVSVCLISTRAGGQGLNLFGASRVVIFDEWFNPMLEQQAIGRAYRIGQLKHVFVYRLNVAGTFEEAIQNQSVFKEHLATRVVDKKNPVRSAKKTAGHYLFPPKDIEQESLDGFAEEDPLVLAHLLAAQDQNPIRSIVPGKTYHVDDGYELTLEEKQEVEQIRQFRRRNPEKLPAVGPPQSLHGPTNVGMLPPFSAPSLPTGGQNMLLSTPMFSSPSTLSLGPAPTLLGPRIESDTTTGQRMTSPGKPAPSRNGLQSRPSEPSPILAGLGLQTREAYQPNAVVSDNAKVSLMSEISRICDGNPLLPQDVADEKRISGATRKTIRTRLYDALKSKAGNQSSEVMRKYAGGLSKFIRQRARDETTYHSISFELCRILQRENVDAEELMEIVYDKMIRQFTASRDHTEADRQDSTPRSTPHSNGGSFSSGRNDRGDAGAKTSSSAGMAAGQKRAPGDQDDNLRKKAKTTSAVSPGFKSTGPMEEGFKRFLDADAARSAPIGKKLRSS